MASIIRIKRSGTTAVPVELRPGELAYSWAAGGDKLFIGAKGTDEFGFANEVTVIGGEYFTAKLDHTPGVLTANSAIITDANNKIDILNVDNITIDGNTISSTNTNGNIILDPNGSGNIDVSGARITNLGEPTANSDAVTKGYLDSELEAIGASANFNYTGDTGSDSLFLAGETLAFIGGTGITTAAVNNSVTFTLDNTGVSANTYGSSTEIPILTIDAQGRITLANTASISTDLTIAGDSGSGNVSLATQTLTIAGGTGLTSTASNTTITLNLDNTAVTAGSFGSANTVATFTVDSQGRLTAASNASIQIGTGQITSFAGDVRDVVGGMVANTDNQSGISVSYVGNDLLFDVNDFTITLGGDLTGNVTITDLTSATLTATIAPNSVELGTDTTGNYVASVAVTPNTGLSVSGTGEGAAVTLAGLDATTTSKGVASFNTNNFTVSSGAVSTKTFTIGSTVINNGNTVSSIAGLTSLEVGDFTLAIDTIATANGNIVIAPGGDGNVSVNDNLIRDVADPQTPGDAANKRYVDEVAQGLKVRQAAWVITVSNLAATYDPDGFETGWATLTASSVGAFPAVDGVSSETLNVAGARILVTAQTNPAHNGLYVLMTPGNGSTAWVLRRCSLCRTSEQIPGSFVFVQQGTIYADTGWVATVADVTTFTIGEDAITWVQFSGAGSFLAGNGLTLTGNVFSVNVDDSSIEIVSDNLRVKASGITNDMLAGNIANDKLVNSTITIAAESGTADPVSLGETITFAAGEGIDTVVSNNTITISGEDASDTNKGIASFSNTDFIVSSGHVAIDNQKLFDTIGASIDGGRAITVTYVANTVVIDSDLATTSSVGVASFNSDNFAVANGDVTIIAIDGGTF